MNTGTHVVRNKQIYNIKFLDKGFKKFLEQKSGHPLTKLRLIVETPSFTRWMLEGIQDKNYGNYKEGSLFQKMRKELGNLFQGDLLRVCKKVDNVNLILDFRKKEDIFRRFKDSDFNLTDMNDSFTPEYITIL